MEKPYWKGWFGGTTIFGNTLLGFQELNFGGKVPLPKYLHSESTDFKWTPGNQRIEIPALEGPSFLGAFTVKI